MELFAKKRFLHLTSSELDLESTSLSLIDWSLDYIQPFHKLS